MINARSYLNNASDGSEFYSRLCSALARRKRAEETEIRYYVFAGPRDRNLVLAVLPQTRESIAVFGY